MFTSNEISVIENMPEEPRPKNIGKKGTESMLLCLDSGHVTVYSLKKKDEIELKNGECDVLMINNRQGMSEDDKY